MLNVIYYDSDKKSLDLIKISSYATEILLLSCGVNKISFNLF